MNSTEATRDFLRTLAEARTKTEQEEWGKAADLWEKIVAANPVDGNFWASLGNARYQAGDFQEAIEPFERALRLGSGDGTFFVPGVNDPFPWNAAYRIACCYAKLGDTKRAFEWIEKALDGGYRDLEGLREDDLFAALRGKERFRELVGIVDETTAPSRAVGWACDLGVFADRIRRKAYDYPAGLPERDLEREIGRLTRSIGDMTDAEIVVDMMNLLARLDDGHAGITLPDDRPDLKGAVPFIPYLFEDGLHVIATHPDHTDLLGAKTLTFGDIADDEVVDVLRPIICHDNDQNVCDVAPFILRRLPIVHALGLIPAPDSVTLAIVDGNGEEGSVTIGAQMDSGKWASRFLPESWVHFSTLLQPEPALYLRNTRALYWFEYLAARRTVYFQFNGVANDPAEDLASFSTRLGEFIEQHEVDRLIVDVRWNGGGNTFLEEPLLNAIRTSRTNQRGSLWVVIGRHTYSAAMNFITTLSLQTKAIFVGEPSGSRPNFIGEGLPLLLPYSKLKVNVSDLYWQTSWPMDYRVWIAPLLYTPPRFEDLRHNRDAALDAIFAVEEHLPGV